MTLVLGLLDAADALIDRVPSALRKVLGPVLAPLGAAARTLLLTVTGNVSAVLDEPVVSATLAIQAFYAVDGASVKDRLAAAALVLLRQVVHTGVGPNASDATPERVGDDA